MIRTIERGMDFLTDHYLAVCLFIALFILTWAGVGDIPTVSVLGMILCLAGFARQAVLVDLWILFPLILYNLAGMVSSYAAYRNITDGYASLHLVYPVIYLLMACLEEEEVRLLRRLCVVWAGVVAATGIGSFVSRAVLQGSAGRMEGFPGNPNATGIFLVLGWFALMGCDEEEEEKESGPSLILSCVEPLLLIALALTLSMGSFTAMAVGILVVLTGKRKGSSGREIFRYACRLLSGASLGVGTGVLFYLAAARTSVAWICLPLLVYGLAVVLCWNKYKRFLKEYPWMAVIISVCGLMVAAAVIAVRPGSVATFTERLEMMRNGLGYLVMHPLTGVGPYQWRILNLHDSDKYFNTWHIHNVLLHVGVEQGWIAMGTLLFMAARFFGKKPELWKKAGFMAFCIHNMMDTSFFYMSIMALMMMTAGNPRKGGRRMINAGSRAAFGIFAVMFAYHLYFYITHG